MESNMECPINRSRPRWRNNRTGSGRVSVPMTYRTEWPDGFGARGWKLDAAIRDQKVIASTSYTGENIPTSVLVHDILDHYICGFGFSGHRNEAMAVTQLGLRTGSEIRSSYDLMVDDILRGDVEGESLDSFLSEELAKLLPSVELTPRERMQALLMKFGMENTRISLLAHFYEIGLSGIPLAMTSWQRNGLEYSRHTTIGFCLQELLERAEYELGKLNVDTAHAKFLVTNVYCELRLESIRKRAFRMKI